MFKLPILKNSFYIFSKKGTLWDDSLSTCNHANKVKCSSSSKKVSDGSKSDGSGSSDAQTNSTQSASTSQAAATKAGGCSQANYRAVPDSGCSKFCLGGVAKQCGPGLSIFWFLVFEILNCFQWFFFQKKRNTLG